MPSHSFQSDEARKRKSFSAFKRFGKFCERRFSVDQQIVGKKFQASRRGDRRIQHAHSAGSGVARIGKNLAAGQLLLAIQFGESFFGHDNFAAHFEIQRQLRFFERRRIDTQRYRADRFYIGRDVFAGAPVAARYGARERSTGVLQRNAQAIEFVLRDVLDFFAAAAFAHAAVEFAERFIRKSVVQAQHGPRVLHGLKTCARGAADAHRGRIRGNQFRVRGFQLLELAHQPVVGGVGNFRIVGDVIAVFVMAQFFAQVFDFVFYGSAGPGHATLTMKFAEEEMPRVRSHYIE